MKEDEIGVVWRAQWEYRENTINSTWFWLCAPFFSPSLYPKIKSNVVPHWHIFGVCFSCFGCAARLMLALLLPSCAIFLLLFCCLLCSFIFVIRWRCLCGSPINNANTSFSFSLSLCAFKLSTFWKAQHEEYTHNDIYIIINEESAHIYFRVVVSLIWTTYGCLLLLFFTFSFLFFLQPLISTLATTTPGEVESREREGARRNIIIMIITIITIIKNLFILFTSRKLLFASH